MHFRLSAPIVWIKSAFIAALALFAMSASTALLPSAGKNFVLTSFIEHSILITSFGGAFATLHYRHLLSSTISHKETTVAWALSVIWGAIFCFSSLMYRSIYNPLASADLSALEHALASVGLGLGSSAIGLIPTAWLAEVKNKPGGRP
jgi:branched-subunit amino acid ABC-type transport system permease component